MTTMYNKCNEKILELFGTPKDSVPKSMDQSFEWYTYQTGWVEKVKKREGKPFAFLDQYLNVSSNIFYKHCHIKWVTYHIFII